MVSFRNKCDDQKEYPLSTINTKKLQRKITGLQATDFKNICTMKS